MAIGKLNSLFKELSGALGKEIVVKQYRNKTVICTYPAVNKKKKPSPLQKLYRDDFKAAVKYAQAILRNHVKKKAYEKKLKAGEDVYHYAMREYKKKYGLKKGGKE